MGFKCLNKEGKRDSGDENFLYVKKKIQSEVTLQSIKDAFLSLELFYSITTLEIKPLPHLFLLLGFAMGRV